MLNDVVKVMFKVDWKFFVLDFNKVYNDVF